MAATPVQHSTENVISLLSLSRTSSKCFPLMLLRVDTYGKIRYRNHAKLFQKYRKETGNGKNMDAQAAAGH